ncbi:MAG: hydantoinase/oxoprolinase family protein [Candidatus Tectomicrobia bacterium]|nr:hydantoinase/oxoprolinase family protein [Candidatus Tectomicrobia bacterium]
MLVVGIDIGGTFTDFITFDGKEMRTHKVLSTPSNQSMAVLQGLRELGVLGEPDLEIVHGSTVATNALLERKGGKVALITTQGFEDVLEIGRQNRPSLYDLNVQRLPPLVPSERRLGVPERTIYTGEVIQPLDEAAARRVARQVKDLGVDSLAICLLFSYANPSHEQRLVELCKEAGIKGFISASHQILPEYREYERTSTTVVNAYVVPVMDRYLSRLSAELGATPLRIMQSNGGAISAETAKTESIRTVLSGPAGGVVGALFLARLSGYDHIISFDMGGTSTDVSLCEGGINTTTESVVAGNAVRVPMIELHTVGAGGGSIARLDEGGALRVGPESAGADPGPICYGKGTEIAVTDANVVLGRISPDHFLGGRMKLHDEAARRAVDELARAMRMSREAVAEGIVRVANATMQRAIQVMSVERGHDPRDFALLSFGGAGGLHCCELAENLSIPRLIIPNHAGLLSAFGMITSDVVKDYSQTVLINTAATSQADLAKLFEPLDQRGLDEMLAEGLPRQRLRFARSLDMRYIGQSFEISVPWMDDYIAEFHRLHGVRYGYSNPKRPTEIVNLRLRTSGEVTPPEFPRLPAGSADPGAARLGASPVYYRGAWHDTPLYERERLQAGNTIDGLAVVYEKTATTLITPGFQGVVDEVGNIILTRK